MPNVASYADAQPVIVGQAVPKGACDGLLVTGNGNLAYTTVNGTPIAAYAVTASQIPIPVRVKSVDAGTTAAVLALYNL